MQILNFWVDIEDANGVKQGKGPLRPSSFTCTKPLSASGEFGFDASINDPNLASLAVKRAAICRYVDANGDLQIFDGGIIDKIETVLGAEGDLVLHVSGNDLTRELTYRSVGALKLEAAGAGVTNGPTQIIALAPAGWSITNGTTSAAVYAGFDGEPVLSALIRVGEHVGEHWRLGSGREIEWIGPMNTFASCGYRAVQHVNDPIGAEQVAGLAVITALTEINDATELLTRVIPRGSGNGSAIVTLAPATASAPSGYTLNKTSNYLMHNAAETSYGRIERALDYKEIGPLSNSTLDIQNAANALLMAAYETLRRVSSPQKFYNLELANVGMIKPGTTMRVVYRQVADGAVLYDLDDTLNVVEVEQSIDSTGFHTVRAMVSTIDRLPVSDDEYLAGEAQKARIFTTHQQLGASVDTMTWRDEMDNSYAANFRFWLGEEYTTIQSAKFRFQLRPLRSTVKSVAGSSTTSSSGGGESSSTGQTGGNTTSNSSHQHDINVFGGSSGNAVTFSGGIFYSSGAGNPSQAPTTFEGGHSHSIPNHSHSFSVSAHTHTVNPTITTVYGIYEEGAGNTLALSDIVIQLNGGADLRSQVVDIGNGWYELDISDELVNAVFRPAQENNVVTFTTSVAKKARIEAQLTVRGVVQAVAYSA